MFLNVDDQKDSVVFGRRSTNYSTNPYHEHLSQLKFRQQLQIRHRSRNEEHDDVLISPKEPTNQSIYGGK